MRLACTWGKTCEFVWPPNASLYASWTCVHLRLLASQLVQGFKQVECWMSDFNKSDIGFFQLGCRMSYFGSRMTDGGIYKFQYALAPLIRLFCRLRILEFFDRNVVLCCSCFSVAMGEITSHENRKAIYRAGPTNPPVLQTKNSRIFWQKCWLVLLVFFGCYGRPWFMIFVESSNGVR